MLILVRTTCARPRREPAVPKETRGNRHGRSLRTGGPGIHCPEHRPGVPLQQSHLTAGPLRDARRSRLLLGETLPRRRYESFTP
jgi:hypothetical protein